MSKANSFEWAALRTYWDYIAALPQGSKIPNSDEATRYIKLRRFIIKWVRGNHADNVGRAMIDLADEFQLDWYPAARLFVRLQNLSTTHSTWRSIEDRQRGGDPLQALADVRNSLFRLGRFSASLLADNARPRDLAAIDLMRSAAHKWADDLHQESTAPGQYERWEEAKTHGFSEMSGYDAHVVLDTWLRCNVLFDELVKGIIEDSRKPLAAPGDAGRRGDAIEPSSAQSLAGIALPRLYKGYIGKKYSFSMKADGELADAGGPRFARMCYPVMGMPTLSIATLRVHWQSSAVRAQRAQRA
jgi:hypothetical protein